MITQRPLNNSNIVFTILIFINVVGLFVVKDNWVENAERDWTAQISKVLYGLVLLLMFPSFFANSKRTVLMKCFIIYMFFSVCYGYYSNNTIEIGVLSKKILVFISFVYFDIKMKSGILNKRLLNIYVITLTLYIFNLVIRANVLETALETGETDTGQGTAVSIVYLIPLVAYLWKEKYVSWFYIFAFLLCLISLRRTAIIACLICLPFMFKYLKNISSNILWAVAIVSIAFFTYFIYRYWFIFEQRFMDMFVASEYNETYGSGRSAWFALLLEHVFGQFDLFTILFGYGIGAAGDMLIQAGYLFRNTHSDYIELVHDTGILGLLLYYAFFIKYSLKVKKANYHYRFIVLMTMIMVLMIELSSSYFNNPIGIVIPLFYSLILNGNTQRISTYHILTARS